MADHSEDSLIREIDEELRQDQFHKLWSRYGKLILIAAGLCVAAAAGYQFWVKYDLDTRQALGERFVAAQKLAETGSTEAAVKAFKDLAGESRGYGMLARIQEAGLLAKTGDTAAAIAAYDAIAGDSGADKLYRDLAVILAAGLEVNDPGTDTQKVKDRLAPSWPPEIRGASAPRNWRRRWRCAPGTRPRHWRSTATFPRIRKRRPACANAQRNC